MGVPKCFPKCFPPSASPSASPSAQVLQATLNYETFNSAAGFGASAQLRQLDVLWYKSQSKNCEKVADKIEGVIGGSRHTIVPNRGNTLGVRDGIETGWFDHTVIVKDGRVYDALTGPDGLSIEDFKKAWDYQDDLDFGF